MTESPRKFCLDRLEIDVDATVTETAEYLTVKPVTLIREGVYPYDDGRALKPGDELARAASVSRLYIAWDHPPLKIITKPQEIKGFVDGIYVEKDNKGVKVKGTLRFNKNSLTQDQQELIRSKIRRDVSLGFYYTEDRTPGSWNGQPYDYIQRDFVFDHVASVDHGRCPYPQCGIGVDVADLTHGDIKIGNDPYPNEHACRILDPSTCQANSFRRMNRGRVSLILARPKTGGKLALQAIRYPKATWSAAEASADCKKHGGQFVAATGAGSVDQGDSVMSKEEDEIQEAVKTVAEEDIVVHVSATVVDTLTPEQKNKLPRSQWGYAPGPNRSEWKLPCPDKEHVIAALQALQGARGGVTIPRAALPGVKRKVCSFARREGVKSKYCGTADNAADLLRTLRAMAPADLVRLHAEIHKADDYTSEGLLHRCVLFALQKTR